MAGYGRRYVHTGAPGAGKTSMLRLLESREFSAIGEAATAVIALDQAAGAAEHWTQAAFIDRIVALRRRWQSAAAAIAAASRSTTARRSARVR